MTLPQKLGKYEVRREIGQGGMGVVYEGYDPLIERRVALKVVRSAQLEASLEVELLARLRREAQAAGRLNHPNIVAVYDYGEEPGIPGGNPSRSAWIAMEFVEGRELASLFESRERLPMGQVARIMGELLAALQYSHERGVVHRDIKPANILLLPSGTVKVADFGIARIESSTLTQVGTVMGSPSYMSPEQFMGQTVDGRSDLYSAGVVLYQLLTGELPFSGSFTAIMHRVLNEQPTTPSALNVQSPLLFDGVIRKAIAKRPQDRYQSAAEFKAAINAAVHDSADALVESTVVRVPREPPATTVLRSGKVPMAVAAAAPGARTGRLPLLVAGLAAVALLVGGWFGDVGGLRTRVSKGTPPAGTVANPPPAAAATRTLSPASEPVAAATPVVSLDAQHGNTMTITAVGIADPRDPRFTADPLAAGEQATEDARRQLIQKAAALYVEPDSLVKNYGAVINLLARNDAYIRTMLNESTARLAPNGFVTTSLRATVDVREVQKSLNQMSRDERVQLIRNSGDPRIAVSVLLNHDDGAASGRSQVAENVVKARIRSFGFSVFDADVAKTGVDFYVRGTANLKRLTARLPASGVTVEKFALTSFTVNAVDAATGEEVYTSTEIPKGGSWASEELALEQIGRLVGERFSKSFFLENFDFSSRRLRVQLQGFPQGAEAALLSEIEAVVPVLNAALTGGDGPEVVLDIEVSGGTTEPSELVQAWILRPLNRKLGHDCFTVGPSTGSTLLIAFAGDCRKADIIDRFDARPPAALLDAARERLDDIGNSGAILQRVTTT